MDKYKYETDVSVLCDSDEKILMKITLETENEVVGVRLKRVLDDKAAMKILDNVQKVYLENK